MKSKHPEEDLRRRLLAFGDLDVWSELELEALLCGCDPNAVPTKEELREFLECTAQAAQAVEAACVAGDLVPHSGPKARMRNQGGIARERLAGEMRTFKTAAAIDWGKRKRLMFPRFPFSMPIEGGGALATAAAESGLPNTAEAPVVANSASDSTLSAIEWPPIPRKAGAPSRKRIEVIRRSVEELKRKALAAGSDVDVSAMPGAARDIIVWVTHKHRELQNVEHATLTDDIAYAGIRFKQGAKPGKTSFYSDIDPSPMVEPKR